MRPFKPSDLATLLKRCHRYVRDHYLTPMVEVEELELLFPSNPVIHNKLITTRNHESDPIIQSFKQRAGGRVNLFFSRACLREYAEREGLVVDEVFKITESSTRDTRKEFEKILERIRKSRETIALVADTIDRVERSFKESVVLDNLRKDEKWKFIHA